MPTTTTISIFTLIDSSPFWSSFLAQLLASFIIVVIGSFIIPPILRWNQRPRVKLIGPRRKRVFEWTQSEDNQWETTLHLSIRNEGKKTLERFYWELYVEHGSQFQMEHAVPYSEKVPTQQEQGEKYIRTYGYIEMPLFPLDDIDFPYRLKLKRKDRKPVKIYYYFRTDFGIDPFWSWLAFNFGKISWLKSITIR